MFYADDRVFGWIYSGAVRMTIDGQEPKVLSKGWAFNVAASANLPALVMLLFWRGTTKQGITAAIIVGLAASQSWAIIITLAMCHHALVMADSAALTSGLVAVSPPPQAAAINATASSSSQICFLIGLL